MASRRAKLQHPAKFVLCPGCADFARHDRRMCRMGFGKLFNMNNHLLFDAIGWVGAAALLVAYAMVSSRKWEGHSSPFQLMNIGGSVLLAANTIFYGAYPSTFVNIVWAAIAIFTIATSKRVSSR